MIGTVFFTACFVCGVVLAVVDTVVDREVLGNYVTLFIFKSLLGKRLAIRVRHSYCNGKRVEILDRFAILIHNLLGDIDTALQGVGRGEVVGHGLYRFNAGNSLTVCSICEDNIIGYCAHDHRVMMVSGQFKVIVDLTFFPNVVVAFLENGIRFPFPLDISYTCNIIAWPSGAVGSDHKSGSDGKVISLSPRDESFGIVTFFGLSFEFDPKRFFGFRIYVIIFTVN